MSAAMKTCRWDSTRHRLRERRCCICASISTSSRLRNGSSNAEWTSMRKPTGMPVDLADIRHCLAALSDRVRIGEPHRSRHSYWIMAQIQTSGLLCKSNCMGAADETLHTYRDVTPLEWGRQFHDRSFVDNAAMKVIAAHCGL